MKKIILTAYDEALGKWIYTKTYRSCAWDEMAWFDQDHKRVYPHGHLTSYMHEVKEDER